MRGRVSRARLAVAYARHRAAQVLLFGLLGLLLSSSVVGAATVRASAEAAAAESVRAELGQRAFALQTSDADVTTYLAGIPDAAPVQDDLGEAVRDGVPVPVAVRTTTDPTLALGVLTAGARPSGAGEVLVSELVAERLGVAVGDTVSVRASDGESDGRIVGFVSDPADATSSMIVRLVEESPSFEPTRWLSDTDFYSHAELQPALDRRAATYQSVEWLLLGAEENPPALLGAIRFIPIGAAVMAGLVSLSAIGALSRTWASDAGQLIAAGLAPRDAWRRVLRMSLAPALAGVVAGACVAPLVLQAARAEVSAWFGQSWRHVSVPWPEILLVVVAAGLAWAASGAVARQVLRLSSGERRPHRRRPPRRRQQWPTVVAGTVAGAGAVLWLVAIGAGQQAADDPVARLAPIGASAVVGSAPLLIAAALGRALPGATRSLFSGAVRSVWVAGAVAALIVLATGTWSAQAVRGANVGESLSPPPVPAGSFVISAMPDTATPALRELYGDLGGSEIETYGIPGSEDGNLRVASPGTIHCMHDAGASTIIDIPEDCLEPSATAPINTVLLGPPGSRPLADAALVSDGAVGLMWFSRDTGSITRAATTDAEPGEGLGGNLPGLVVPPDGAVAEEFGLVASGMSEVLLSDFHRLTPEDQYQLRAGVLRLAPGAEVADGTSRTEYDRIRTQADVVSAAGAVAAAAVLLLGGGLALVSQRLTRRALADVGFSPARRTLLAACWTLVPVLSAALALALAFLTASAGGRALDVSFGELWYLPGAAGIMAGVLLGVAFGRVPGLVRRS